MYVFILNKAHWGDGVTVRRTASHTTSVHSRVLSAGRQCPPITVRVRPFPRVGQLTTQGLLVTQTFTNGPCLWRPALGRGQWQAPNARTPSGDGGGPDGVPGRTEQGCLLPCPSCLASHLAPSGPFPWAAPPSLSGRPSSVSCVGSLPAFRLGGGFFCRFLFAVSFQSYGGWLCSPHLHVARPSPWHLRLREAVEVSQSTSLVFQSRGRRPGAVGRLGLGRRRCACGWKHGAPLPQGMREPSSASETVFGLPRLSVVGCLSYAPLLPFLGLHFHKPRLEFNLLCLS